MSENIKNWLIGILIILTIFLGINYFSKNLKNGTSDIGPTPTIETITETPSPTECISSSEAWNRIGQIECVEYYVENPFRSSKGNIFLNEKRDYKNGFTVWIPSNYVNNFSGDPISMYGYKTIQVTGLIRMYQGHPEIIVNSQNQIIVK